MQINQCLTLPDLLRKILSDPFHGNCYHELAISIPSRSETDPTTWCVRCTQNVKEDVYISVYEIARPQPHAGNDAHPY